MSTIAELVMQKENIERRLKEADVKYIVENNVTITREESNGSVYWIMYVRTANCKPVNSKVIRARSDEDFFLKAKELQNDIAKAIKQAESKE